MMKKYIMPTVRVLNIEELGDLMQELVITSPLTQNDTGWIQNVHDDDEPTPDEGRAKSVWDD